ncbi:MAG: WG repeat-containing protein [Clostridium sp.]|uniref:WG repeat-containing protein n=1 Tax=Clostridium sp. TaxID=1506 RepID=UPI003EE495D9
MDKIVCRIYDFDIDRTYDGIILDSRVYLLNKDGEPEGVKKIIGSFKEKRLGCFYIDEEDFDDIGDNKENYKWGYFYGGDGRITVLPIYDEAYPFEDGLASIKIDGKYGFIDYVGREVIEPIYEYTDICFRGGRCPAKKNGKFGYIDKEGNSKILFKYDFCSEFLVNNIIEGKGIFYAIVEEEGKYGIIDIYGQYIVEAIYEDIKLTFFEDILVGKLDNKYGIFKVVYDKDGKRQYIKYVAEHLFTEFGGIIGSRQIEDEHYFYTMKIDDIKCIINKKLEIYFGEEGKEYIAYKGKKILVDNYSFSKYNRLRYRDFKGRS